MTWSLRREKKLARLQSELKFATSAAAYARAVSDRLEKELASKTAEVVMLRLRMEQQRRGRG